MAKTSLAIEAPYPHLWATHNGNGTEEDRASSASGEARITCADPRQPILSNFRVLARINAILRAVRGGSTRAN